MALTNDDLLAISQLLDTKLQNFATKDDLRELENNILEEVDTVQEKANDHFKRVEKRLDDIETELHASSYKTIH